VGFVGPCPEGLLEEVTRHCEIAGVEGEDATIVQLICALRAVLTLCQSLVADVDVGADTGKNLDFLRIPGDEILKECFGFQKLTPIEDLDRLLKYF